MILLDWTANLCRFVVVQMFDSQAMLDNAKIIEDGEFAENHAHCQ